MFCASNFHANTSITTYFRGKNRKAEENQQNYVHIFQLLFSRLQVLYSNKQNIQNFAIEQLFKS